MCALERKKARRPVERRAKKRDVVADEEMNVQLNLLCSQESGCDFLMLQTAVILLLMHAFMHLPSASLMASLAFFGQASPSGTFLMCGS